MYSSRVVKMHAFVISHWTLQSVCLLLSSVSTGHNALFLKLAFSSFSEQIQQCLDRNNQRQSDRLELQQVFRTHQSEKVRNTIKIIVTATTSLIIIGNTESQKQLSRKTKILHLYKKVHLAGATCRNADVACRWKIKLDLSYNLVVHRRECKLLNMVTYSDQIGSV